MTNRPHRELSDKIQERFTELLNRKKDMVEPVNQQMSRALNDIADKFEMAENNLDGRKQLIAELRLYNGDANPIGWGRMLQSCYADSNRIVRQYNQLRDAENLVNRNDAKAARRALFFRTLTTFFVGFAIMAIYAIAAHFEIQMPLSGLKVAPLT